MEVLQWARVHGCPWEEATSTSAASSGHLEILQWAREKGCPWGRPTYSSALGNNHPHVMEWLEEHGSCHWQLPDAMGRIGLQYIGPMFLVEGKLIVIVGGHNVKVDMCADLESDREMLRKAKKQCGRGSCWTSCLAIVMVAC